MNILSDIIAGILSLLRGRPRTMDELGKILDAKARENPEHLDWRNSIVDLLKLTGHDSSLQAREALASELGYLGPLDGSAAMNIWLHTQVMQQLSKQL